MTTDDDDFARKITPYLDEAAAGLRAGTAYRLQLARAEALARLAEPERAPATNLAPALAGAGAGAGSLGGGAGFRINRKLVVGLLLAIAAYFGYHQWQAYQQLVEIEETDAAILSSDLPIDAYLDRGFQNWLKSADAAE
jgi:hypothetical protein